MKCGTCRECHREDVALSERGSLHPHDMPDTQMPCKGAYDQPTKVGIYSNSSISGHDFIIVDASERKPTGLGTLANAFAKIKVKK